MNAQRPAIGGMTFVEALVSVVVGLMALAAIALVIFSIRRMERAGDLSGALQEASLAMAVIQKDLTQAVQKPDPSATSAVLVTPRSFQLLRGISNPDGTVHAKLVVYRKEATRSGNFRLKRKFGDEDGYLPGVYRAVRFVQLNGAGGPFVRATLHLAVHDRKLSAAEAALGTEDALLTSLVRIQGPEMVGSPAFGWNFLKLLNSIPWSSQF